MDPSIFQIFLTRHSGSVQASWGAPGPVGPILYCWRHLSLEEVVARYLFAINLCDEAVSLLYSQYWRQSIGAFLLISSFMAKALFNF